MLISFFTGSVPAHSALSRIYHSVRRPPLILPRPRSRPGSSSDPNLCQFVPCLVSVPALVSSRFRSGPESHPRYRSGPVGPSSETIPSDPAAHSSSSPQARVSREPWTRNPGTRNPRPASLGAPPCKGQATLCVQSAQYRTRSSEIAFFAYCASVAQYVYSLSAEHCFGLRNNTISDERVRDCAVSTHSTHSPSRIVRIVRPVAQLVEHRTPNLLPVRARVRDASALDI